MANQKLNLPDWQMLEGLVEVAKYKHTLAAIALNLEKQHSWHAMRVITAEFRSGAVLRAFGYVGPLIIAPKLGMSCASEGPKQCG